LPAEPYLDARPVSAAVDVAAPAIGRGWWRAYRAELGLVFGRRRNLVLIVMLGLVPALIGVALKIDGPPSGNGQSGPRFLDQVTENGLFLVFTALAVTLPLLIPLVLGIVSGDTVAGEASGGTLRYLLTVPVSRGRLLAVKAAATTTYAAGCVAVIGATGLATGAALFPVGELTLLSGDRVPLIDGLGRGLLVGGYVLLSLTGLLAAGLFFSTLTEVPVAAMAATIVFAVASQVVDSIPQLHALHPFLLTHHWLDFGELLRIQPRVGFLLKGLAVQAAYVVVAASLAWSRFTTKDITA
jgi:ABC-2 type transport system permease protein